jgi:hypothetical protein
VRKYKDRRRRRSQVRALDLSEPGPNDITLSKRAQALAACIRIYPDQLALGLARQEEAGWCFGRLYLVGAIDMQQYGAAKRLDRVVSRYKRDLHRHGLIKTSTYDFFVGGGPPEDLSDVAVSLSDRISQDYMALCRKLDRCGDGVRQIVFEVLEQDILRDLMMLRNGLNALI